MEDLMKLSKDTLISRMAELQARLDAREDTLKEARKAVKEARAARQKKMVRVKLVRDQNAHRDDLFVAVNGERYLLRRGVELDVPDYIAEAIAESVASDAAAQARQERLAGEYEG